MMYAIPRADKVSDQLYSIIQYIAEDSGSVDVALNYLEKLVTEIRKLSSKPYIGSNPRYSTLKKQGYLVLTVQRHLVFYKVDEEKKQVMIYAVVDARQHYVNLI